MNLGPHQNYESAVHHRLIIGIGTVGSAGVSVRSSARLPSRHPSRFVIRAVLHLRGVNWTQDGVKTRCTQFTLFLLAFTFYFSPFFSSLSLTKFFLSFVPILIVSFCLALFLTSFVLSTFPRRFIFLPLFLVFFTILLSAFLFSLFLHCFCLLSILFLRPSF